jgi:hypothetical protein
MIQKNKRDFDGSNICEILYDFVTDEKTPGIFCDG